MSPLALLAIASESASVPAPAAANEHAVASIAFADLLLDATTATVPEEGAPTMPATDKGTKAFWMGMPPMGASDEMQALPESSDIVEEEDELVAFVPVSIVAQPPVEPSAPIAIPEFDLTPATNEGDVATVSISLAPTPAPAAEAPAPTPTPTTIAGESEREQARELEFENVVIEEVEKTPIKPTATPSAEPAPIIGGALKRVQAPVESSAIIEPNRAPSAAVETSPAPTTSEPAIERQARPTPHTAMDALILPAKEQVENSPQPELQTTEAPLKPTAISTDKQTSFSRGAGTGTEGEETDRGKPAAFPTAPPRPATTFANHMLAQEPVTIERPAAPVSATPARELERPSAAVARALAVEMPEAPAPASTPLKRIEIRIPDPLNDVVLQVQERRGAVQVTVRTEDARTANDIATHLPDLTRSLGQQGFRTETAFSGQLSSEQDWKHAPGRRGEADSDSGHRRKPQPQEDFEEYLW
ncbi:MAG TPA: hypothetical protein VER03_23775 [Bryobacteraceae bacterium]|nr:hypothetical protein [Bryobacteraceae bacterium]